MYHKNIINKPIIIGKLKSAYGIKGYLNIISFTEKKENIFFYHPWFILHNNIWIQLILEKWEIINNKFIIKIKNFDNRNHANTIINSQIFIENSQLPKLNQNEYYWHELIGCQVITTKNYHCGYVYNLIHTGSNDVLITKKKIKTRSKTKIKEYLIPFINKLIIKNINFIKKIITVDWDPNF